VVNSAVSFLHPEWPFGFDLDVPPATKARMAFLDRAAADKTLVGSYHLTLPCLRARRERGERLPLAAGRLALDGLTAAPAVAVCSPAGLINARYGKCRLALSGKN
jgi:hypothetical protein